MTNPQPTNAAQGEPVDYEAIAKKLYPARLHENGWHYITLPWGLVPINGGPGYRDLKEVLRRFCENQELFGKVALSKGFQLASEWSNKTIPEILNENAHLKGQLQADAARLNELEISREALIKESVFWYDKYKQVTPPEKDSQAHTTQPAVGEGKGDTR